MIPERSIEVLRAIVQDYIATSSPVGSKALVDRHGFNVSAATIRNDMALLEEEELIAQTHTSSGRIPTDKGYRLFVDRLDTVKPLTDAERAALLAAHQAGGDWARACRQDGSEQVLPAVTFTELPKLSAVSGGRVPDPYKR